ncbi:MAG: Ig-like domain-containing protein [Candidatus Hodarchaeales archaeon]|jgi:hypothetical protein
MVEFTLDTIPPNLIISSPLTQVYTTDTVTVTLSGADHYWYYIESVDSQNQTWTENIDQTLADGAYTLHAYGNDSAGNIVHVMVEFIVDANLPQVSIDSPLAQTYTTDTITVTLSGADHYWYYIESVDSQNQTWTVSVERTLSDNVYVLHAYGNDSAGNVDHELLVFTIEKSLTSSEPTTTTTTPTTGLTPSWGILLSILTFIVVISLKRRR